MLFYPSEATGTLANMPKSRLSNGRIYRPTDGILPYRANGSIWQPLASNGLICTEHTTNLVSPLYEWVLTGSGTSEYAVRLKSTGGNPGLTQPGSVFLNNIEATVGTAGSLAANTWAWGSYSGYNTVIVRLTANANPNSQFYGYVRSDPLAWLAAGAGNSSISINKGLYYLATTSNGATLTARGRFITAPATPYTLIVGIKPSLMSSSFYTIGPAFSDGTQIQIFGLRHDRQMNVTAMSNATTFTGDDLALSTVNTPTGDMFYLAVRNDGTNKIFYTGWIPDINYMNPVLTQAVATRFTPNRIGIATLGTAGAGGSWFPHFVLGA